jgi:hypothetical protein
MAKKGAARTDDPWTSHHAADKLDATVLENICYAAIKTHAPISGLTTHEIKDLTGIEYGSVTPRMVSLEEKGLVERALGADGNELTRVPAGRKRPGIIWRLTKPQASFDFIFGGPNANSSDVCVPDLHAHDGSDADDGGGGRSSTGMSEMRGAPDAAGVQAGSAGRIGIVKSPQDR